MKENRRAFLEKALLITGGTVISACTQEPIPCVAPPKPTNEPLPTPATSPLPDGLDETLFALHNPKPLALESLRHTIGMSPITSTKRLFVRNNLPRPSEDIVSKREEWTLNINGVPNPKKFTLAQLQQLGMESITAVLQCSGNGRAFFTHSPSGSPWKTGAAGCVVWTGVPLSKVFAACGGALPEMKYLTATGGEPLPKDIPRNEAIVERSIPIEKAQQDCLLAWELNGEPISVAHGGPLRLVVPGYFGCNQIKYVNAIAATTEQTQAKIQKSGYRFRPIGEKGSANQPSMWRMPVKSWIVDNISNPTDNMHTFFGVAFSGERGVSKVEYSTDGISWLPTEFYGPDLGVHAWRCFRIELHAVQAPKIIYTRATDTQGDVQPKDRIENERGYGNNSWLDHGFSIHGQQETANDGQEETISAEQQEKGKNVFLNEATPSCGTCHTLADAQTTGQVGPNLDQLKPTALRVQRALENGVGAMPSYGNQLSTEQIQDVARYVAHITKP